MFPPIPFNQYLLCSVCGWSKGSCVLPWVLSDLWSSLNLRGILDLAYLVGVCHGKSHLCVNITNTSSFSFKVILFRWNSRWKKVSIYSSDLISLVLKPFYTLLFTASVGDRGERLDMPWMMEEPMNQRWEGSFSTLHTTTDTHMPPTKDTHKALSTQPTDYSYTRHSRALWRWTPQTQCMSTFLQARVVLFNWMSIRNTNLMKQNSFRSLQSHVM